MESDECLECKNRYDGCLRLGNMMRVCKKCDRYDELFIMSLTGDNDNGDDKRDSI